MTIFCNNVTIKKGNIALIENIKISLNHGEITVVLGANGAGKSTLLKALCGFEKPSEGEIYFNDRAINQYSLNELAKMRSVLSQQSVMHFPFDAMTIALMGRHPFLKGNESSKDIEIAEAALKKTEVYHLRNRIYPSLSGGEQQRVQLARALCQIWSGGEGNYLFLDEPVSNLDLKNQYMVLKTATDLTKNGVGVFCILHDLNLAQEFADKIIMMKEGKIFKSGKKEEIFNIKNLRDLFDINDALSQSYLEKICTN